MARKIDIALARKLRADGQSLREIASRFGCTKQAVQQLLAYRHSSQPGARIIALIKRGYSDHEIAAIHGVTAPAVRYHRKKIEQR